MRKVTFHFVLNDRQMVNFAWKTTSSAVAVMADRTAYEVRYTGKLSNHFQSQV